MEPAQQPQGPPRTGLPALPHLHRSGPLAFPSHLLRSILHSRASQIPEVTARLAEVFLPPQSGSLPADGAQRNF